MNEYAHGDMRDQWVYRLNLTQNEINRMVAYGRINGIGADYYFFDENAFNMLYLLEVAAWLAVDRPHAPWVFVGHDSHDRPARFD